MNEFLHPFCFLTFISFSHLTHRAFCTQGLPGVAESTFQRSKEKSKELDSVLNEQKKINPLTGGKYLNGCKPSHPILNGNVVDAIQKAPGYAGRQGTVVGFFYGISCIPYIGTPVVAFTFANVCRLESHKTGSIFQGIKNTCVNLIYER